MTVYTVSSADDLMSEPLSTCVIGSYTTRGRALDECVAYIMERLENRQDFAWSMLNDENHPEARKLLVEHKDGTVGVRKGCVNRLKKFVRDELDEDGKCQVDLDDGCCVSCVLYHSDAKNVKE